MRILCFALFVTAFFLGVTFGLNLNVSTRYEREAIAFIEAKKEKHRGR